MELQGKKLVFLGDSITEGVGVSSVEYVYWKELERRTGAICVGYGIGGTTIAPQRTIREEVDYDRYPFVGRVDSMDEDADVVIVFGGTNDYGHGDEPFGCMDDRETDTFYGSLHVLCRKLIKRYPAARVVFFTPLHRLSEYKENFINGRGARRDHILADYAEAIRQVAEYYSMPVLDLHRVSGICPGLVCQRELFMPDGLHPNEAGHIRIADLLQGFLTAL